MIVMGSRPFLLYNSAMAGTTEFTGFTIISSTAFGQNLAHASAIPLAMPALVLNESSRDWPGLRGTPSGTSTKWMSSCGLHKYVGVGTQSKVSVVSPFIHDLQEQREW